MSAELEALERIVALLEPLSEAERERVLAFVTSHFLAPSARTCACGPDRRSFWHRGAGAEYCATCGLPVEASP